MVGFSALDQAEWPDCGIGVRRKQRELWEIPRSFRISDAGGENARLLIGFRALGQRHHTGRLWSSTLIHCAAQSFRSRRWTGLVAHIAKTALMTRSRYALQGSCD